jgi:exopolysaccharide biosynthesis polyprenyl glycosylphosphotransferase
MATPRTSGSFAAGTDGMAGDWHAVWRLGRAMRKPALAPVRGRRAASKEAAEDTYDAAAASGGLGQRYGDGQPAERYLSDWEVVQKSTFDLTLATLLLPFLCPLMLVIAAAIRFESRGPILFRQPRAGLDGRPFTIYKFRTMYHHMADIGADRQTSRGDPRVTKLGRVLRRYSLDELPQLLNVFRGDMSLVGPRPHAPQTTAAGVPFAQAVQEYYIRHSVKPGITGWAQVNGARGEVATIHQLRKRVAYDLFYIMNWSVFFDIKIIVLTIRREVFSQHAF